MAAADCHSRPRVPPRIELTSFTGLGAEIYTQTRSLIHCKRPPSDMKNSASAFLAFIASTGLRPGVLFFSQFTKPADCLNEGASMVSISVLVSGRISPSLALTKL
ncbi:hypothetical protein RRG08_005603 [Elysia crispata]|uniref:Uncharacterized protein n=1 Tax=Elysia crispata TaxID=231223 RepID=A0AAE0YXQ5_9GAST|nr:hypothetical protein RRG08_005603 [Elysia crispata]